MNLATHAEVLWRYRAVTFGGILLGIVLAILASYQITFDGGPSLSARGTSTWSSESDILVTQSGFPEGRVILPGAPAPGTPQVTQTQGSGDRIEFADPARFNALADLYSQLATSDAVRSRIPERPKRAQITAIPLPAQSGEAILPVIQLTTQADSAEGARKLNANTVAALQARITDEQDKNDIPASQRAELSVINASSKPTLVAGASHTGSILALLLCLIGTVAVTHLLASLRDRRELEGIEGFDNLVVPWSVVDDDDEDERPGEAVALGSLSERRPREVP